MTKSNPKDPEKDEEDAQDFGHINVKFVSPGSVFFDFELGGIVPMQMIVIGEYLLTLGKSQLLREQAQVHAGSSTSQQIEIARPGIDPVALSKVLTK